MHGCHYCRFRERLGVPFAYSINLAQVKEPLYETTTIIQKTKIGEIVFEERKESSPCALCAKMRKGTLNDYARQIGCNKVAYAHHMDDIIETMFLSMFYEGQFYSFAPVTHLDRSGITVIRPLMYVPEANVIGFLHKYHLPLVKNPCPADGETKREYVKQLVRQINLENPGVKNAFSMQYAPAE